MKPALAAGALARCAHTAGLALALGAGLVVAGLVAAPARAEPGFGGAAERPPHGAARRAPPAQPRSRDLSPAERRQRWHERMSQVRRGEGTPARHGWGGLDPPPPHGRQADPAARGAGGPGAQALPPGERERMRSERRAMTPDERAALRARVRDLPPDERRAMVQQLRRYRELPPDQQQAVRERLRELRALPPGEQQEISRHAEKWRSLSPADRARLRERWRRLQALPPAEREQLLHGGPGGQPGLGGPPRNSPPPPPGATLR